MSVNLSRNPPPSAIEEVYAALAANGPDAGRIRSVVSLRHWFHELGEFDQLTGELMPMSLTTVCERILVSQSDLEASCKDRLQKVLDHVREPLLGLIKRPVGKLIREQAMLPVRSARELDSSSFMALSRRPGRTIREKLAGKPYLQAIRRSPTLDTIENRLMKALCRRLTELLQLRQKCFRNAEPSESLELLQVLDSWFHGSDAVGIGPWTNLPPNNTLLQHRSYRRLWKGWRWLQAINEDFQRDYRQHEDQWAEILFWTLLTRLRELPNVRIAEQPVFPDYDHFRIDPGMGNRSGAYSLPGCIVSSPSKAELKPFRLRLSRSGRVEMVFDGIEDDTLASFGFDETGTVRAKIRGEVFTVPLSPHGAAVIASKVVPASLPQRARVSEASPSSHTVVDLAFIRPRFGNDHSEGMFRSRLLWQLWQVPDRPVHELDLGTQNALALHQYATTVSIFDLLSSVRPEAISAGTLSRAARHFSQKILDALQTESLTYLVPDAVDDFSLEILRTNLNARFPKAEPLPRSIAAAMTWQSSGDFIRHRIRDGAHVLVIDAVAGIFSATPLIARYKQQLAKLVPETRGIYWERCPTVSGHANFSSTGMAVNALRNGGCFFSEPLGNLCGLQGVIDERDRVSWLGTDESWFSPTVGLVDRYRESRKPASNAWDDLSHGLEPFFREISINTKVFLLAIGDTDPDFVGLPPRELIEGHRVEWVMPPRQLTRGGQILRKWQTAAGGFPLWQDNLPELSVRILVNGSSKLFHLVKDIPPVSPKRGVPVSIPIKDTFDLEAGHPDYDFPLLKGAEGSKLRYKAKLKSPAFPLRQNTPCKLFLTFTYGEDNPYELCFQPLRPEEAGFQSVKVEWQESFKSIPWELLVPKFPPRNTWADLKSFRTGKDKSIDLLAELQRTLDLNPLVKALDSFYKANTDPLPYPERSCGEIKSTNWDRGFCFVRTQSGDIFCHIKSFCEEVDPDEMKVGQLLFFDIRESNGKVSCANTAFSSEMPLYLEQGLRKRYLDEAAYKATNEARKIEAILKSRRNAMNIAWNHGHHLCELDAPPDLRNAIHTFTSQCLDLISIKRKNSSSQTLEESLSRLEDAAFYSLCSLSADTPDDVFERVREMQDHEVRRNWLPIGLLIGDASQERQKRLYQYCVNSAAEGDKIWMQIVGVALWRAKNLATELPFEIVEMLAKQLCNMLAREPVIRQNYETKLSFVSPYIVCLLELCLGLLRSREATSTEVKRVLAVGSPLARRLEKIVEDIDRQILGSGLSMNSRVSFQLEEPKPKGVRSHDLLYALQAFLTGEFGAIAISVTSVDDNG
ncbi:MAG: Cold-shock DNA-binding domain protein [Chthoniobacteraceae bacterium]|nr:Cold-shock DNA-binding domain protein [Chthoniobacteraceae bacterium]